MVESQSWSLFEQKIMYITRKQTDTQILNNKGKSKKTEFCKLLKNKTVEVSSLYQIFTKYYPTPITMGDDKKGIRVRCCFGGFFCLVWGQ
jgi:hypothetical protein